MGLSAEFDKHFKVRLSEKMVEEMDSIIERNKDLYENKSHFIRCGLIKLINDHRRNRL